MKRRFRWPSRRSGDLLNTSEEVHDAGASRQHTTAPLREPPNPASANRSSSIVASSQPLPSSTANVIGAANPSIPQHAPQSTPQDGTSLPVNAPKKDYWQLAVDQLQKEDSSVAEQITGVQQAAEAAGNVDLAAQLLYTAQQGQQELESKRWKISAGSREIVLRDQFDRLVKAVTLFKDVGNAAGSVDPLHAGLPLAGFCVLMQIAANDSEQYGAMVSGVEEIVTIMARYSQFEALYLSRPKTVLKQEFAAVNVARSNITERGKSISSLPRP